MSYELDENFGTNNNGVIFSDFNGGDAHAKSIVIDKDNNIVAVGRTWDGSKYVFVIVKIDQNGDYVNDFSGGKVIISDLSTTYGTFNSVTIDNNNNIIATGYGDYSSSYDFDFIIVKIDQNGNYVNDFSGGKVIVNLGEEYARKVVKADNDNNIIVAGWSLASNSDFMIVKLDQSGNYVSNFTNTGTPGVVLLNLGLGLSNSTSYDEATSVVLDKNNNIIVSGHSEAKGNGNFDFAIVKIDQNGNYVSDFTNTYSGMPGIVLLDISGNDYSNSIALDKDNNIIIAGESDVNSNGMNRDFAIVKIDQSGNYVSDFTNTYSGTQGIVLLDLSGIDQVTSVALDNDNNIIVTGYTTLNNGDFAIVKIDQRGNYVSDFEISSNKNSSNTKGVLLLDLSSNSDDTSYSVIIDKNNNIFVAGSSFQDPKNYFTIVKIKYIKNKNKITKKGFYMYRPFRISPYYTWLQKRNKKINQ